MTLPVIVIGGGGHAGVVIDSLRESGRDILGLLDRSIPTGTERHGVPVLGDDGVLEEHPSDTVEIANGLGSVRSTATRAKLFLRLTDQGYAFTQVRHPSAVISPSATLGQGCQVMAGAVVQPGAKLGTNSLVNTRASVDHDCKIGAHVHIAPGATLSGGVTVEERAHIGVGAVIAQGVTIGAAALLAAGAIVTADVPARALVRPPQGLTRAAGA